MPDYRPDLFSQASEDARAFMDLRFKHFTTFAVIQALIGGAAIHEDALRSVRWALALLGLALTVLFWLLDARTQRYHQAALARARDYERALGGTPMLPPAGRRLPTASTVTNLIFILFLAGWASGSVVTTVDALGHGNLRASRGVSDPPLHPACGAGSATGR